jgi:hypothetical protein
MKTLRLNRAHSGCEVPQSTLNTMSDADLDIYVYVYSIVHLPSIQRSDADLGTLGSRTRRMPSGSIP